MGAPQTVAAVTGPGPDRGPVTGAVDVEELRCLGSGADHIR